MKSFQSKTGLFFLILFLGPSGAFGQQQPDFASERLPSLMASIRITPPLAIFGEQVPLDNPDVRERLEKELLLILWNRPQVILWIKRSGRYFPHMEKILKENNMPEDLKYLAIIESALMPHARSSQGAVGFWQFMEETGLRYDLRINPRIDERRDIFASTRAAVNYFKKLYKIFGSWALSAAAYNMGEKGLQAEILVQKINSYFQLYLPLETQRFIFQIISAKLILTQPEKYGFELNDSDLYPPLQFDRIQLEIRQKTSLEHIARAANTYFKVVKDLNPQIRGYYLYQGTHHILIPAGASKGFHERLQEMLKDSQTSDQAHIYIVKTGDSLSKIAGEFNVPLPALLIWNHLDLNKPIHPGNRLIIYPEQKAPKTKG
ncbi:MAG: transglycosylase SLT domain-containing protein [Desulfobacterales bacterium]|nr:transglycosylase SLT domain-containing protein [Desulfobacterales bacterium]